MTRMTRNAFLAIAAIVAGSTVAVPAAAVIVERTKLQNATGLCQAALPAFDGLIRKRPLAVVNEGSATAFVTCSIMANNSFSYPQTRVTASFGAMEGASGTVNCTLVDGLQGGTYTTRYATRSIAVASPQNVRMEWDAETFTTGPTGIVIPNISCSLPPGISINYVRNTYEDYVGE